MKRRRDTQSGAGNAKKRVTHATFTKWQRDLDRDCQTMTWLDCETMTESGKKVVEKLKCKVCTEFVDKIRGRKNFSDKWICGADSVRTSNVRDHAHNDQHTHALSLLKKQRAQASGLGQHRMLPSRRPSIRYRKTRERLKVKFDIAYFIATEKFAFTKYPKICELEARHGVHVGTIYRSDMAGKDFVHYIAEAKRKDLLQTLAKANFFSLLMDGSTDTGNIDNEILLVVWCDPDGSDEKVHTRMDFLTVSRPQSVTARGLFQVLEGCLQGLGIQEVSPDECQKLVGVGTDGAAANIAASGLKGLVEGRLGWVFWMWCMAHRLELAIKDALKGTTFDDINEMLLRLFYLYEKSPKKCRELEDIIADLRDCMCFDDAGVKPVRASGSRWVAHKLSAMKRVISKFGAYTNHLAALSEDPSVRSADRAKLKGYHKKWIEAKYILGCALFVDLLSPCSVFSKFMQSDEIDILGALTGLLKTLKEINKLGSMPLDQWPTYAATMRKITEEDDSKVYQCQELKHFSAAVSLYSAKYGDYASRVTRCIKSRLSWSDMELMRDIIFMLSTHGWEKALEEDNDMAAIDRLVQRFTIPLQGAAVDTEEVVKEFSEMISYATQYIALSVLHYHSVWWRLFHAPCSSEWANVLVLAQLLFSLPASNGKLERVFSLLGVIKVNKRSLLSNDTLDDLLLLNSDKIPLDKFDPNPAIDLWWSAKARRPSQKSRKQYKPRLSDQPSTSEITDPEDSEPGDALGDWDDLVQSSGTEDN